MRQAAEEFVLTARVRGAMNITGEIVDWVRTVGITTGLLTLHVRHTSASLVIQENADPQVMIDLENYLQRLVPPGDPLFRHTAEGPDDMPAHVRSALTSTTLSIPVVDGRPALGMWQGIYLYEHRDHPRPRRIAAHIFGE